MTKTFLILDAQGKQVGKAVITSWTMKQTEPGCIVTSKDADHPTTIYRAAMDHSFKEVV
jgi:hypothetical protein